MSHFNDKNIDITDRVLAVADICEEDDTPDDVVAMLKEAAQVIIDLRKERDTFSELAGGKCVAEDVVARMGPMSLVTSEALQKLAHDANIVKMVRAHCAIQQGMAPLWEKSFTEREGLLQTALHQIHECVVAMPVKKKTELILVPGKMH